MEPYLQNTILLLPGYFWEVILLVLLWANHFDFQFLRAMLFEISVVKNDKKKIKSLRNAYINYNKPPYLSGKTQQKHTNTSSVLLALDSIDR